jgi:hypothetical protein
MSLALFGRGRDLISLSTTQDTMSFRPLTLWTFTNVDAVSLRKLELQSSTLTASRKIAATQRYGGNQALGGLVNCAAVEMCPEMWVDTTGESLIHKYRVMTVVGSTSSTSSLRLKRTT